MEEGQKGCGRGRIAFQRLRRQNSIIVSTLSVGGKSGQASTLTIYFI
jgi:hypothetical protein